ncbi:glycosyltransferase family 4 protein [Paenibacillus barengoltzii]|uniref:glycosyltransferase family 4 protein n=1 Tax=Paenibacillus barengoltzii TaxID=343517 RepID=UPI002DB9E118|nr:glycosyltransferase family 4 protein [Paenibacillus barengoltzii]
MIVIKNSVYRFLYKLAILCKPLVSSFVPSKIRKRVRNLLTNQAASTPNIVVSSYGRNGRNFKDGINLVGYCRAEMGVGESCRAAARSMNAAGIPFGILNFKGTSSARMADLTWQHKEVVDPEYGINIFHINAEEMKDVYAYYGPSLFEGRYNIGFWHWELPDFPDEWLVNFSYLQEIWVPSTFVADSISLKSPIPVVKIPHSIEVVINENRDRSYFGLPEGSFLFLSMYDIKSFQERKNPKAAIEAFKLSFRPDDMSVGLVVKINKPGGKSSDLMEIKQLIAEYQNIYLIDRTISRNDVNALISVTDCFISLHRSEGFGLVIAEAMYLAKPVIGTNWSSTTDFMNHNNSCLVDYELVALGEDYGPYKAYQYWANPKISHASEYMIKLVNDQEYYRKLAEEGERYIKQYHSPEKIGKLIYERLAYIKKFKFGG